jgi:hypothetical protein
MGGQAEYTVLVCKVIIAPIARFAASVCFCDAPRAIFVAIRYDNYNANGGHSDHYENAENADYSHDHADDLTPGPRKCSVKKPTNISGSNEGREQCKKMLDLEWSSIAGVLID